MIFLSRRTETQVADGTLRCPVCGNGNFHLCPIEVEQGHTKTTVARESTVVEPTDRHVKRQGSLVTLQFYCERHHSFEFVVEFEKGVTSYQWRETEWFDDPDASELWRD